MPDAIPLYVLDASIAFKWLVDLGDEPHTDHARNVLDDYRSGRVGVVAPSVLPYEVGHAVSRAVRRERLGASDAADAFHTFLEWKIPLVHDDADLLASLRHAEHAGASFYDASYLTLAVRVSAPWLHADERIRTMSVAGGTTLPGLFPVTWIEDYRSPANR